MVSYQNAHTHANTGLAVIVWMQATWLELKAEKEETGLGPAHPLPLPVT